MSIDIAPTIAFGVLDEPDLFERQPTPEAQLPDPKAAVCRIAQALVDVLGGQRPATQLSAWTSSEVLAQVRAAAGVTTGTLPPDRRNRPRQRVVSVRVTSPAPGVVEASAVVGTSRRSRALAMRLEGLDGRWRCTALRAA